LHRRPVEAVLPSFQKGCVIFREVNISRRGGKTMRTLAVIVLGIMMLSAAFVGIASAQPSLNTSTVTPFSAEMNFMSQAGYARYLNHLQSGQWTPFTP
jgi:hypothetical protein